jgi:thiamine-monophosphate kinase
MRESDLLRLIYGRSRDLPGLGDVVVGPGDDCAVVRAGAGSLILLKVDQLVEGLHFKTGTSVELIARKAIARSVSDIAAMGGAPTWGLATGLLPAAYAHANELFDAMARWARHWGCPLVGGDIAMWREADKELALTVTVGGVPHAKRGAVLRSGAKPGDEVWLTGRVGSSLESGRHLTFEPRLREGAWLCDSLGERLHAMIDLSDGLGIDAGRIGAASGMRIVIDEASVPRHEGVADWRRALGDGEDYELLFTCAPGAGLPSACPATGTALTRIGSVAPGSGCVVRTDGRLIDVSELGWDYGAPPANPPQ